ncbi:hypothetical protein OROGR_006290 [Orobanche gracilis]
MTLAQAPPTSSKRLVILGSKGFSLTSTDVSDFANDVARITIDSSAISGPTAKNSTSSYIFSVPDFFTVEETRASLLLLLNKLLLSSFPSAADQLQQLLEKDVVASDYYALNYEVASDDDLSSVFFYFVSAAVDGVSALLDYYATSLSSVADAVAAISCEALRADASPFNMSDSGDGSTHKDAVSVAAYMKVFLTGSKLVNSGNKGLDSSVAEIPLVHGDFREICRSLHSKTRVQLKSGFTAGSAYYMSHTLLTLALSLSKLGNNSILRTRSILENSMLDNDLRSCLSELNAKCPTGDCLKNLCVSSQDALGKEEYLSFVHNIFELLDDVRQIVSWEAVTAFVALEGNKVFVQKSPEDNGVIEPSGGGNAKTDKKGEKKKKVVLGKGSIIFMQFIKDTLLPGTTTNGFEKFILDFLALLDPRNSGSNGLVKKVKEIVESKDSRRRPKLPKGTDDCANGKMAIRERAFSIVENVFKRHGAMALDTPVFELREYLLGKYGEDSKLIYDLADQGGELCSLRYDLTVPFARYVAMNKLNPFRRYQIAKVYRRDNPAKGRSREFYQCDFDIAGEFEKMGPDFEVIKILTELLDELNIGNYEVKLNHRKLLDGMLAICGVPPVKFRTICSSIDKLDKQSFEQIRNEMVEEKGLTKETADKIGTFVKQNGRPLELLSKLQEEGSEFLVNDDANLALDELKILFKALEKSKCIDKIIFDLSLARGLDYYTGVIFEAVFRGSTQVGSIAAGGRYDNLIGTFGTEPVPAVGISLGIERVFTIMLEQHQKDKKQETRANETQVLVSILGDDLALGAELVSELWGANLKAEFMFNKKVQKHIDRAVNSKIPYMVILGERELEKGIVKLKDVTAKQEYEVPRSQIVKKLLKLLNSPSPGMSGQAPILFFCFVMFCFLFFFLVSF